MLPRSVHPVKGSDYAPPPWKKKNKKNKKTGLEIPHEAEEDKQVQCSSSREAESKENKFSGLSFEKVLTVM